MELPNYSRQVLQQLHTLCKEQHFCDCTIFIGSLQFRAHKLVLAAASLLFKSLLENTEAISIDASVVTPEEFSLLLEMMYSGKLPPGKHNLTKIISVADSLQMFDVAVSCKNLLTELMNHSTASQKLKDAAVQPVPPNKTEIIKKHDIVNPRNEISNETTATEKLVSPIKTVPPVDSTNDGSVSNASGEAHPVAKPLESAVNLLSTKSVLPDSTAENLNMLENSESTVDLKDLKTMVSPPDTETHGDLAKLDTVDNTEATEKVASPLKTATEESVQAIQEDSSQEEVEQEAEVSEDTCVTPTPCTFPQPEAFGDKEENAEPASKKRRLEEYETKSNSSELDFLIRYESIFSEALSDPQSVLENLEKCRQIKETEKQAVMECCQAEEGSSTFTKLLEKVKDGQSIVVETVLALLKLCRHSNPNVNKVLLEKEPPDEPEAKKNEKSLFDLLLEHKEELIQSITELSPIIECLDTAEEGFLTNREKQVIIQCCEGGSHKEAMAKLVDKVTEAKLLSPDSFVKLLQAVREAFPDLHSLLDMLEPQTKNSCNPGLQSPNDYGTELLKQYYENISEVVTNAESMLNSIMSTSTLTAYESEVMEQIVKKNSSSRIFSTLMASILEEQSLTSMPVWQLLFSMQESNVALKSIIEEIRKDPGAEHFFHIVINRKIEATEIILCYSEIVAQALQQCDLKSISPENEALTGLVKELSNIPNQKEDSELPSKQIISSALKDSVPVMLLCDLLSTIQDSVPDLQPAIKELELLGLIFGSKDDLQTINKWHVDNESQIVIMEFDSVKSQMDGESKDGENEEGSAVKENIASTKDSESTQSNKKSYICKSCDKIFLFRCRLEVHMKRCRMAKKNPLECKDCNEVQASKKELDQHREEVHGCVISPRSHKMKRRHFVTCDICGKEFAHPSGLQYHKRTEHFDEKPFSCNECGAKFAANSTLKNHQRLHTGERPFVCKHCHMTFTQAAALSYHTKKKHSEGKMYVCQYCDAVFAQSIELTRHVRTHTGDKPYVCRECGKGFSQANGLSIHLRTFHNIEDPYDCQKCRMSFPTLEEHRQHIQVVHSKEYHPCPTCEKIFSAPSLLERHIVTHVGGKPYNCEICDKAYQQLSGLWYHNRTHHPDLFAAQNHRSPKFSLQCTSCDQSFSNTSMLQKQAKGEHTDDKLFVCEKCKQTYPTFAALQVHVKCKHSGSQPFQCLYCNESFQFPGALQHHVATEHFSETDNTFGCELCGELFTAQPQLEKHYETDHPEILFADAPSTETQVVQVIQDQVTSAEQVITLDESQLSSSQVIVALPDSQTNQAATELVAVSMEDLLDGTVTLICGDSVTGVTQRTQS
ncbi:zinc finger and BTB domain-containing protein 40 [Bombina bombina]|uniref:zinc finger and BTB domain-containing protein 40 n=1 Tax=Bombina bombina TaxID=8345 RepID=UPI00235B0DD2|nr:zinc finger and BTB domain-containing protein 40 [Bombina bombina]